VILEIFSPKKLTKNWIFFTQITAISEAKIIITLFFNKNAKFFAENNQNNNNNNNQVLIIA
jgi:hypothetical protein